jgi:hypothetical protein
LGESQSLEFAEKLQHSDLSIALQTETWLTPALQAVHILMIGIVFGSMLLIALRVLGRMRADEPFAAVWGAVCIRAQATRESAICYRGLRGTPMLGPSTPST